MTPRLSRRQGRVLALAILIAAVAAIGAGVVLPLHAALEGQRETVQSQVKLLAAYRSAVAQRPAMATELKALKSAQATTAGLIDGATTALAAARLQMDMKKIVEAHGGEIRSAQNLPAALAEGFETVELRYDITLPMKALGPVVYEIETHTPYLFIDGVDIHAPEALSSDQQPAQDPMLSVRWDVRAYRRAETP